MWGATEARSSGSNGIVERAIQDEEGRSGEQAYGSKGFWFLTGRLPTGGLKGLASWFQWRPDAAYAGEGDGGQD